jgi:competence protein ComEC
MLFPVPGQVLPGGRDMQRELYFAGIGGVGYSYGGARRIATPDEVRGDGGWREWLLRLRNEMTRRIAAALPGATGGVASAVITGKRVPPSRAADRKAFSVALSVARKAFPSRVIFPFSDIG